MTQRGSAGGLAGCFAIGGEGRRRVCRGPSRSAARDSAADVALVCRVWRHAGERGLAAGRGGP
eukprot:5440031-Prorocentrum_lima.AAC.1